MPKPKLKPKPTPAMTQLIDGRECVTISEAARLKRVSRQAIWVRVQRGTLPHLWVGDRLYVPLDALRD